MSASPVLLRRRRPTVYPRGTMARSLKPCPALPARVGREWSTVQACVCDLALGYNDSQGARLGTRASHSLPTSTLRKRRELSIAVELSHQTLRYMRAAARGVGTHRHAVLQLAVPERRRAVRRRAVRGGGRAAAGLPSRAHGGGGVCGGGLRARRQLRRAAGLQLA